jgi:hypothetical protein
VGGHVQPTSRTWFQLKIIRTVFRVSYYRQNRVLGRIFGPRTDEVTGERRKSHSEEFCNMYLCPNIIRQIKSGRMRWAGHVRHMGVQGFGGKARRKETTQKTET